MGKWKASTPIYLQKGVGSTLRPVFGVCRCQLPYRIAITFGFVLYNTQTNQFEQFFALNHLARSPKDRVVFNQIPNMWISRNEAGEDAMIRDSQQTDFFYLLHDRSDSEQYNLMIVMLLIWLCRYFQFSIAILKITYLDIVNTLGMVIAVTKKMMINATLFLNR